MTKAVVWNALEAVGPIGALPSPSSPAIFAVGVYPPKLSLYMYFLVQRQRPADFLVVPIDLSRLKYTAAVKPGSSRFVYFQGPAHNRRAQIDSSLPVPFAEIDNQDSLPFHSRGDTSHHVVNMYPARGLYGLHAPNLLDRGRDYSKNCLFLLHPQRCRLSVVTKTKTSRQTHIKNTCHATHNHTYT